MRPCLRSPTIVICENTKSWFLMLAIFNILLYICIKILYRIICFGGLMNDQFVREVQFARAKKKRKVKTCEQVLLFYWLCVLVSSKMP